MEQVVTEVALEMGVPSEVAQRAVDWAQVSLPGARKMAKRKLNADTEHVLRMYFRAMLFKLATDPEYRRNLRREIQARVERN
jgi:hypothetical protein